MELEDKVINDLLNIEHNNFAKKIGFLDEESSFVYIDRRGLSEVLAVSDRLSRSDLEDDRRKCIGIVALCWQYADESYKESLRENFTVILSRVGVAPSTVLIDEHYKETHQYSEFESYIGKLVTLLEQAKCEVEVGSNKYLFSDFQKKTWHEIEKNRIVCISAPTSAGKSYVIYLYIIKILLGEARRVIFIVPTISLINQVIKDISKLLQANEIKDVELYSSFQENFQQNKSKMVLVLTQERAISAFSGSEVKEKLDLLVVDEVQNIERASAEDDQRSKILYDFLKEVKHNDWADKTILSGPMLNNIQDLGRQIFDDAATSSETIVSPVFSLTYSVGKVKSKFYLRQYTDVRAEARQIEIKNSKMISGIGKSLYNDDFHNYLCSVLGSFPGSEKNIVFSPNPGQSKRTSDYISRHLHSGLDVRLKSLSSYLQETVHAKYSLAENVLSGVAYHNGRLPMHARVVVEEAFSRGIINNLVCTTTLMQGVNFPASNILIRSPNLFVKRHSSRENPKLSSYEFSNLRGRAGRLLKDFVGRTIVLDESSFDVEPSQEQLFETSKKEISVGYKDYYQEYEGFLKDQIANDLVLDEGAAKNVLTYIRQNIYRYGLSAKARMRDVGIDLDDSYIEKTIGSFSSFSCPRDVIFKNRYWDPFDLELLFHCFRQGAFPEIPNSVWDSKVTKVLVDIISFLSENFGYYFGRYIGSKNKYSGGLLWEMCYFARDWAKEKPIYEMLNSNVYDFDESEKIEDDIALILNKVSYGVPILLKPVADIVGGNSALLGAIEAGAYHHATRFLIAKGVARDTAIYLKENFLQNFQDKDVDGREIIDAIRKNKENMNFWIKVQLDGI